MATVPTNWTFGSVDVDLQARPADQHFFGQFGMHAAVGAGLGLDLQVAGLPGRQFHVQRLFLAGGQQADLMGGRHVLAGADGDQA